MSKFEVTLPFTGYACVQVEAEDEKSAINAAMEIASLTIRDSKDTSVGEWEFTAHVTRGNVTYALMNDASADLIEDEP